jgi:acid phosphatase
MISPLPCPFPNAPPEIVTKFAENDKCSVESGKQLDPSCVPLNYPNSPEGAVTPDGYAVNTIQSSNPPYSAKYNSSRALPLQTQVTIGDLLSEANITWNWYAGGWNQAVNGTPDHSFQYHHQPFNYFKNYAPGQPGRYHLKDEDDLLYDLENTLPQVSFYKPLGKYNMHPGYSVVGSDAEHKLQEIMTAITNSNYADSTLVVITFDEYGGRFDHVPPPVVDKWGPGMRIPAIFIGSNVRKGYVEKQYYDSTAILKLIQDRWGLHSISDRDHSQNSFDSVFVGYKGPGYNAALGVITLLMLLFVIGGGLGTLFLTKLLHSREQREKDIFMQYEH